MDTNFEECLPVILQNEGGKVDNPRDPGGRTNYGITQRTYNAYRLKRHLTTRDVYIISLVEVAEIYREEFWTKSGAKDSPKGVDLAIFDYAVNSGVSRAKPWAARKGDDVVTIKELCRSRLSFLKALTNWKYFGRGWARRIAEVEAKSIKMATSFQTMRSSFMDTSFVQADTTAEEYKGSMITTLFIGFVVSVVWYFVAWQFVPVMLAITGLLAAYVWWQGMIHRERALAFERHRDQDHVSGEQVV